jgi:hypothetical protein
MSDVGFRMVRWPLWVGSGRRVKSFEGEHWDTKAVNDIRRAFDCYPEAEMGLIVSTATASSEAFDKALDELRNETKKPVSLLINWCGSSGFPPTFWWHPSVGVGPCRMWAVFRLTVGWVVDAYRSEPIAVH